MQIVALRNRFKIAFIAKEKIKKRLRLVTNDLNKSKKYKCKIFRIQHYEQNRCSYFIFYLHAIKNEQSNNIINFFRIRFVYLKFFDVLNF